MAAPVMPPSFALALRLAVTATLALALALAAMASLAAEPAGGPLIDPTRNPYLGRGDDAGEPAKSAPAPAPAPTRLQMILRGPGDRRTAVIDGTKVGVGDTVTLRGATVRVEKITDTTVVLAHGATKETLQLLPGAERAVRCTRRDDSRPGGC